MNEKYFKFIDVQPGTAPVPPPINRYKPARLPIKTKISSWDYSNIKVDNKTEQSEDFGVWWIFLGLAFFVFLLIYCNTPLPK